MINDDQQHKEEEKGPKRTVQFFGFRVVYIDCDHFPVGLTLIDHGQDAQNLHFDYLATQTHLRWTGVVVSSLCLWSNHWRLINKAGPYPAADFTDIDGVVVAAATSVSIFVWRIFPRLNFKNGN